MPLDGRPEDADHRDATRGLIRTPAFPGTRPRSAATASSRRCRCCGAIPISPRVCCAPRAHPARSSTRLRTPSREKSCTRCAAARWRRCGEVPFGLYYGSVDATPLFVMLPGLYTEQTGDIATLRELWPQYRSGAALDRRAGDPDGDGFVEYTARNDRAWSIRAGRIRTTRSSTPTADCRGPIALVRSAGLRLRGSVWRRTARACSASTSWPRQLDAQADTLAEEVRRRRSGATNRHLCARARWRRSAHAGCAHPTLDRRYSAASRTPNGGARRARPDAAVVLLRLGHPHGGARRARGTIRCRTTTARSGRTTTR